MGRTSVDLTRIPSSFAPRWRRSMPTGWQGEVLKRTDRVIPCGRTVDLVRDVRNEPRALRINTDISERKALESRFPPRAAAGEHRHAGRRHRPRFEQHAHADPDVGEILQQTVTDEQAQGLLTTMSQCSAGADSSSRCCLSPGVEGQRIMSTLCTSCASCWA
jgi:hypothetical protein